MIRQKKSINIGRIIMHMVLLTFSAVCILPMILTLSVSFMGEKDIFQYGYSLIPKSINFDSYKLIFRFPEVIVSGYRVSIFITIAGTFLSLLFSALIAYPISRKDFIFQRSVSFFVFFTMLFQGGLIPFYILMTRYLGMKNSIWALIIPLMVSPLHVFLLRIFFQNIPGSLVEAAKLDGVSEMGFFFKIAIQLTKPGLATVALFIALIYWNDAFMAMMFIDTPDKKPLQLLLTQLATYVQLLRSQSLQGLSGGMVSDLNIPSDGVMFAMSVVATGPMLFVFSFFQKYFVSGLVAGAVKE